MLTMKLKYPSINTAPLKAPQSNKGTSKVKLFTVKESTGNIVSELKDIIKHFRSQSNSMPSNKLILALTRKI